MAFSISDFKSNTMTQGGARPALYEITLSGPPGTIAAGFSDNETVLVKGTSIPSAAIAALPLNYAGRAYKLNGFRTFENWTTTVFNDESFSVYRKVLEWMRKLSGQLDGTRSSSYGDPLSGTSYRESNATVKQLGTDGKVKQTYKFYNLWPTEVAAIPLDWSSDAVEEFQVTWCYDYWTHGTGTSTVNVVSTETPTA